MADPVRLVIVDDHPIVRDGLRGMCDGEPDFEVVGEAGDAAAAVRVVLDVEPDVVLMDLRMPGGSGVGAIAELSAGRSRARIVVLTTYDTDRDITEAVDAGATGYLLKDAPRAELFAAIRAAARGESVLSPAVATRVVSRARGAKPEALTGREADVLALVARGRSNREVAAELFVSEATVKTHLTHVFDKLGVKDRAAAVAVGYQRGILGG